MISLLSILAVGFVLGIRHATDADHVVAVTTIVSRQRSLWRAAGVGLMWGIGHTVTIVAAGGAILIFGWIVPQRVGLSLEFSVGIMLIALGGWSLVTCWPRRPARSRIELEGAAPPAPGHRHGFGGDAIRPLLVGCVHGLAGSAAVALLVLPIIADRVLAFTYLLVFGAGTIAGMIVITAALALPFRWTAGRSSVLPRRLGHAAALCSVGFGAFLLYEIGIVDGLFAR